MINTSLLANKLFWLLSIGLWSLVFGFQFWFFQWRILLHGYQWSVYSYRFLYIQYSPSSAISTFILPSSCFLDSRACNHMTSVECHLNNTKPFVRNEQIVAVNGQQLSISGIGSLDSVTPHKNAHNLSNVYFSPHLFTNLVFVGKLDDNGCSMRFSSSGRVIRIRSKRGGLSSRCWTWIDRLFLCFFSWFFK